MSGFSSFGSGGGALGGAGGFSFPSSTSTTNQPSTGAPATGSSSASLNTTFGVGGATSLGGGTPQTGGFSFGTPSASLTATATQNPLSGLTTTSTVTPATSASTTTLGGSTTQSASAPTTTITFKVLEDYINSWMSDLDSQEKDFLDQACQLNAFDRSMIDNGEKIVDLNNEVDRMHKEQEKLDQELDFIMTQQTHLEQSIKKLEDGLEKMPVISKQYGDADRIQTYQLLLAIDNQVRSMSDDLKNIIKRLNQSNMNMNDPAVQISKILNAHMDSLSWIEENTVSIQRQVELMSKIVDDKIKENEKPAKLSFLS